MKEEMKSLHERKVWNLVDLSKGHQPIKGRWIYAVKSDGHKKARFIAKGFTQVFRIDYENTFSPVARFETLWLLLSLAVLHNWELEALDVKTAFLFGELDEEIYMEQPEGFIVKDQERKVCWLRKAIYGLKQAALQWNKQLHKSLLEMGFAHCTADPGTYYKMLRFFFLFFLPLTDLLFHHLHMGIMSHGCPCDSLWLVLSRTLFHF